MIEKRNALNATQFEPMMVCQTVRLSKTLFYPMRLQRISMVRQMVRIMAQRFPKAGFSDGSPHRSPQTNK